jgi:hypothetical protein
VRGATVAAAVSSRGADTPRRYAAAARLSSATAEPRLKRCPVAARDAAYAPLAYTDLALDDLTS